MSLFSFVPDYTANKIPSYIYIYIYQKLRARYRERFVSPRIPWKSSGDHPWIQDFEAKSRDSGPQNKRFEPVFTSFLCLNTNF